MSVFKRKLALALPLITLLVSSLACNAAAASRQAPPAPPAPAAGASEQALESFNDKWRAINLATPDGPFSVTFTEAELTSAVRAALAQAEADSGQPLPVENVQVSLQNGEIAVFGQVKVSPLNVNGQISVTPYVDSAGTVQLAVNQAEFGMFKVDQATLDGVLTSVEESINTPILASPESIRVTDVVVSNGELTVNGTINS